MLCIVSSGTKTWFYVAKNLKFWFTCLVSHILDFLATMILDILMDGFLLFMPYFNDQDDICSPSKKRATKDEEYKPASYKKDEM